MHSSRSLGDLLTCLVKGINGLISTAGLGRVLKVGDASAISSCFSCFRRACLVGFIPGFSCSCGTRLLGPGGICYISGNIMFIASPSFAHSRNQELRGVIFTRLHHHCSRVFCCGRGQGRYSFVIMHGSIPRLTVRMYCTLATRGQGERMSNLLSTLSFFGVKRKLVLACGRRSGFSMKSGAVRTLPISRCFGSWSSYLLRSAA